MRPSRKTHEQQLCRARMKKEEKIKIFSSFGGLSSAQDKTRTCTAERPLPPQSSVYTNFTTWAFLVVQI